jgi:hypothetical protein
MRRKFSKSSSRPTRLTTRAAIGKAPMPAAPSSGLKRPRLTALSVLANRIPAAVSRAKARMPRTRISSVARRRRDSARIVEPTARPRKSVTTLASSFEDAPVSRSTTPDSFIRLPSMSMPMRGIAIGTRIPTTTVTTIGKTTRVRRDSFFRVWGMRMRRSPVVVSQRMIGGWMSGTSDT